MDCYLIRSSLIAIETNFNHMRQLQMFQKVEYGDFQSGSSVLKKVF